MITTVLKISIKYDNKKYDYMESFTHKGVVLGMYNL